MILIRDQRFTLSGLEVPASPKKEYQVTQVGLGPVIACTPSGSAPDGLIILKNNTSTTYNLGFTIAEKLVAVKSDAHPGVSATFQTHPTFYISCFTGNVHEGQMISSLDMKIPPMVLEFSRVFLAGIRKQLQL